MSSLDINEYVTDVADSRGRVNVGTDHANTTVSFIVLNPDLLDRLDGPTTQSVQTDGRLSIGPRFADKEVTIAILATDET